MLVSRPIHFFPEPFRLFLKKRFEEFVGLLILSVAFFTGLSCFSYDSSDPSLNVVTSHETVSNVFGYPGAYYADFMFQYFGMTAYCIPAIFLIWGTLLFLHQPLTSLKTRFIAVLITVVLLNTSLSAFSLYFDLSLPGVLGTAVLGSLYEAIEPYHLTWVFLVIGGGFFCASLILFYYAASLKLSQWQKMVELSYTATKKSLIYLWRGFIRVKSFLSVRYKDTKANTRFHSNTDSDQPYESQGRSHEPEVYADIHDIPLNVPVGNFSDSADEFPSDSHPDQDSYILNAEVYDEGELVGYESPTTHTSNDPASSAPTEKRAAKRTPRDNREALATQKQDTRNQSFRDSSQNHKNLVAPETLSLGDKSLYTLPDLSLLQDPGVVSQKKMTREELEDNIQNLSQVLTDYGVKGKIVGAKPGPVVTLYELEPAPGIKSSRIIGLADDIARSMHAVSARIAVVPGKNIIGIELPNDTRQTVYLQDLLASREFDNNQAKLNLALGKNISGTPILTDLARMPHMIVAGTTGSGKSVGINAMILSLLYRHSPETCRLILIDPKMLEFSMYNDIPHLLTPVVTEPNKAVFALKWAVREMENRYRGMSHLGVRNIENYNSALKQALKDGREITRTVQTGFDPETGRPIFEDQPIDMKPLPYIVIVVDEMADLMMVAGKDIEAAVQRLAQMARAAGIHLIMATQRPSVDVITGTIKANFPTRISFQVTSKFDSRTILGEQGAEQLLGRGDMLFMEAGGRIQRIHGPFVSDEEVERIVTFLKSQGAPDYVSNVCDESSDLGLSTGQAETEGDELYQKAVAIVRADRKASTSYIQRRLQIGYNRAARIIEQMETAGVISSANHVGKREVLLDE